MKCYLPSYSWRARKTQHLPCLKQYKKELLKGLRKIKGKHVKKNLLEDPRKKSYKYTFNLAKNYTRANGLSSMTLKKF